MPPIEQLEEDGAHSFHLGPSGGTAESLAETEYELRCNCEFAASASGPRERAWAEIQRYAAQYLPDGPIEIYEVTRKLISYSRLQSDSPSSGA